MKSIGTGTKIVYLDEIDKAIDATEKTLVMLKKIKCAGKAHSDVRRLGKAEVAGSIPVASSKNLAKRFAEGMAENLKVNVAADKKRRKAEKCPGCKHPVSSHKSPCKGVTAGGCMERITDAAGSADCCPCDETF